MSARQRDERPLGYFARGILPSADVQCRNCFSFVGALNDACPGCGEYVCRVCGCTDSAACDNGCSWVDRDHRLCSECAR